MITNENKKMKTMINRKANGKELRLNILIFKIS